MSETVVEAKPTDSPSRYPTAMVSLHWLVAALVFVNLAIGFFVFEPALRGGGAFRIPEWLIAVHITVGLSILVLLIVRFIVRLRSRKPAASTAGSSFLNGVARLVHYLLYIVVFLLTIVGLVFAVQTNRLQRAFFGGGTRIAGAGGGNFGGFTNPGPGTPRPSFGNQPGGNPGFQGGGFRGGGRGFGAGFFLLPVHLDLAIALLVLIAVHILAAIYHQFILKDHLIGRMSYGKAQG